MFEKATMQQWVSDIGKEMPTSRIVIAVPYYCVLLV
jgi:hypothetical protein